MTSLLIRSLHRLTEKGVPLLLLFFFLGVAARAIIQITPAVTAPVLGMAALLWTAAATVSLTLLADGRSLAEQTSLYKTSYHGLFWTTTHTVMGAICYSLIVSAATAPLLAVLFAVPIQSIITMSPLLVGVFLMILVAVFGTVMVFTATSLILFPVYVAAEHHPFWTALHKSMRTVHGHYLGAAPLLLLAAAVFLLPPVIGTLYRPIVVQQLAAVTGLPLVLGIAGDAVVVGCTAVGTVVGLTLIVELYETLSDE